MIVRLLPTHAAQQRGALHAHILVWLKPREVHKDWQQLPPVSRTVPGKGPKQKSPQDQPHHELRDKNGKREVHEDTIYHKFECGRVLAEMARPNVAGSKWGGYQDRSCLQIAGLARAIQVRIKYPHVCSPSYCLMNSSDCKFFNP